MIFLVKGKSRRLRPNAHILDDPLSNSYDGLKVWTLGQRAIFLGLYGHKGPLLVGP